MPLAQRGGAGTAHCSSRGTATPPGHSRRPAGQSSVAARTEPSQQTTGTGGDGVGAGHASPTGTPTGEPAQNRCGSGHWSAVSRTDPSGQVTEACGDGEPLVGVGAAWSVRVAVGDGQGVAAAAAGPRGRAGAVLAQSGRLSQPGAGDDPVGQGVEHRSADGSMSTMTGAAGAVAGPQVGGGGAWQLPAGTSRDGEGQGGGEVGSQFPSGPGLAPVGHTGGDVGQAPAPACAGQAVGVRVQFPPAATVVPLGQAEGVFVGPVGLGVSEGPGPLGDGEPSPSGVCGAGAGVVGLGGGCGAGSVVGDPEVAPPELGGVPPDWDVPPDEPPVETPPDPPEPGTAPEPDSAPKPDSAPEPDTAAEPDESAESVAAAESCAPAE